MKTVFVPVCSMHTTAGHGSDSELTCLVGSAWPYAMGNAPPAFTSEDACKTWIKQTHPCSNAKPQPLEISE